MITPHIMEIWYKKGCESCEHIKFYLFQLDSRYGGFKKDAGEFPFQC